MREINILLVSNPKSYAGSGVGVETPVLYEELAKQPEFKVFHADSRSLVEQTSTGLPITVFPSGMSYADLSNWGTDKFMEYSKIDIAYDRMYKPHPVDYMSNLEKLGEQVRFVDDPKGLSVHLNPHWQLNKWGAFMPQTIVSRDHDIIETFVKRHLRVIGKPAGYCGGQAVRLIMDSEDIGTLLEDYREEITWQAFVGGVAEKRVTVIEGGIVGCIGNCNDHHWLNLNSKGSTSFPTVANGREMDIIRAIYPLYDNLGIRTLGFDFIQVTAEESVLIEVNAGNVGGYKKQEIISGISPYPKLFTMIRNQIGRNHR